MHLVSSGVQHHLISQAAPVAVQTTANTHTAGTSAAITANRLPHNASSQGVLSSQQVHADVLTRRVCGVTETLLFSVLLSDPLHGEQPRRREDRCASSSRQGGRARAHAGRGPFPSCRSSATPLPAPSRQHRSRQKHRSTADFPAHPWSRYCPLHHSSSWKPQPRPKPAPPPSPHPQSSAASSAKHRAAR